MAALSHQIATSLATVCPQAPPGAQGYVDQLTGYVLWGVIVMMAAAIIIGIGAVVGGRMFAMPHASKVGIISVVVVFIAGIALLVVPPMLDAILGNGCI